jgi:hypothetical protein
VTTLAVFFWLAFCMVALLFLTAGALLVVLQAVLRLIHSWCTRIRSRRAPTERPYLP